MHAIQQHKHGNLDFNYDHSEQHDINNSWYID
jgi:hypothetical protein